MQSLAQKWCSVGYRTCWFLRPLPRRRHFLRDKNLNLRFNVCFFGNAVERRAHSHAHILNNINPNILCFARSLGRKSDFFVSARTIRLHRIVFRIVFVARILWNQQVSLGKFVAGSFLMHSTILPPTSTRNLNLSYVRLCMKSQNRSPAWEVLPKQVTRGC